MAVDLKPARLVVAASIRFSDREVKAVSQVNDRPDVPGTIERDLRLSMAGDEK